jgi:hypothetical protein
MVQEDGRKVRKVRRITKHDGFNMLKVTLKIKLSDKDALCELLSRNGYEVHEDLPWLGMYREQVALLEITEKDHAEEDY